MSMGYWPATSYVVDQHELKNLSENIKNIVEEMEKYPLEELNEFAQDPDGPENQKLLDLYNTLQAEFYDETGLHIIIGYHGEGDTYDEIEQEHYYFYVLHYELFKPTLAFNKYSGKLLVQKSFVELG